MRNIKTLGAVLTAALALAATAGTAVASAHVFKATALGSLSGKVGTQTFDGVTGTWSCAGGTVSGSIESLESSTQKVKVQYQKCTWFGYVLTEFSPIEYSLNANGTLSQLNTATFKILSLGCTVTFPRAANQNLGSVSYKNQEGGVKVELGLTGVTYENSSGCSPTGTFHGGTQSGTLELKPSMGEMRWE